MALLTLHRSPSVCTTPDETLSRRERLQKRESFAFVKGAVLLLDEGAREGPNDETTPPLYSSTRVVGGTSDSKHRHLQAMVSLLRPEDTIKLAVRLESVSAVRVRYLLIVTTASRKHESLLLGMDFPNMLSEECTIGLVLPIWSNTQVYLDGDGGFSVTSAEVRRIFKPVSIQTMWSVLQALHGCCERAVKGAVIPGSGLDWAQHYTQHVESDQQCVNEWKAMTGLESVRRDNMGHSTERGKVEREIKTQLRDIMRTEDLENITSKQVRSSLEVRIGLDMKDYKEFIDNEMMVTMAQMDKPSRILEYLYLGSEWNAANFEELQKNNVGYILNVTMEIDNFFPESFTYMNVRVYDVEATDLLSHWKNTYIFINEARKSGQAVLVHCKMGVSRSASTVIAFLMKEQGWSFEDAFSHVRECRPIVQPNDSFLRQLQTYSGILSASKQRHSALWRRKSKSEFQSKAAQKQGQKTEPGAEQEDGDDEEESLEEEESSDEDDEDVFDNPVESTVDEAVAQEAASANPIITIQDGDKVIPSPSRSGRMDLFSLMQSIQLDDEERLSDIENTAVQRRSPAQRRRSHKRGRGLTYQKAHVDVSPDPSSQSQSRKQEKSETGQQKD